MQDKTFILATDLDGTFLGGSDRDRSALYDWIEVNRAAVGLIFVTGRDLPFSQEMCESTNVPMPDFVVGDVGTTIAEVHDAPDASGMRIRPVPALEAEIAELWKDSGKAVRETLKDAPGLRLQETPFRYRVSYHYDPKSYDPAAETAIHALGLDTLISAECYFDVLPPGVSKGPSLKRLLAHLEADTGTILVAGDTLNDFSLFETGLKGVAVGNSEEKLLARLDAGKLPAYRARGHGAAGIAEAIDHFSLFPK